MTKALWTSQDLQNATLGRAAREFSVSGVSIDSRTLAPGDLYVAIKGERMDGHAFTADALARGAGGALVSHRPEGVAEDAPLIEVADTMRGLEDLGRAARTRFVGEVVAVTGSVGKTTAKELLKLALGALGSVHASTGSLNNQWGVPLTLSRLPRDIRYGVIEVGMNHYGEIRALNSAVKPDVALITTIAPAHIEFFGSLEAIADAKSEIFESLRPGGVAVLPGDCPQFARLKARARQSGVTEFLTFGTSRTECNARLTDYVEDAKGATVSADICGVPVRFRLGAPGQHNATGAVAALATVAALGGNVHDAAAALSAFTALAGRGERLDADGVTVIDECYNANPASMAAALSLLRPVPGRRFAVLGDMFEMGEIGPAMHAGLVDAVRASGAEKVYLCGPLMKSLWDELPEDLRGAHAERSADLAPVVAAAVRSGDTVLVKGSHGMHMDVVVRAIRARRG